ncbi:MAG TPA: hypothetical protein VKA50_01525 [Gammaproteobacteria bacterium]|nr:hypothetical protein [Gammaproteobacteria bacterium]
MTAAIDHTSARRAESTADRFEQRGPKVAIVQSNLPRSALELQPAEPLWKRVPTRDDTGGRLSDFMMLVRGLNKQSHTRIQRIVDDIEQTLQTYGNTVYFADLNLKLNLLWVSVRAVPGICLELPTAINLRVPEAVLIAHKLQAEAQAEHAPVWRRLFGGW